MQKPTDSTFLVLLPAWLKKLACASVTLLTSSLPCSARPIYCMYSVSCVNTTSGVSTMFGKFSPWSCNLRLRPSLSWSSAGPPKDD